MLICTQELCSCLLQYLTWKTILIWRNILVLNDERVKRKGKTILIFLLQVLVCVNLLEAYLLSADKWWMVLNGWNAPPCCCCGHPADASACLPRSRCLATEAPLCQSRGWFSRWGCHLSALDEERREKSRKGWWVVRLFSLKSAGLKKLSFKSCCQ